MKSVVAIIIWTETVFFETFNIKKFFNLERAIKFQKKLDYKNVLITGEKLKSFVED